MKFVFGNISPVQEGDIPNSVTHLTFGFGFNQPLKAGDIPNSVTHLTFGICFNQPLKVGDIPNSVTHLIFGWHFNQPLKAGDIPNSVTHLIFGWHFNQPLNKGDIPNSVTHLIFKEYDDTNGQICTYSNDFIGVLPERLVELVMGKNYSGLIDFSDCENLRTFEVPSKCKILNVPYSWKEVFEVCI